MDQSILVFMHLYVPRFLVLQWRQNDIHQYACNEWQNDAQHYMKNYEIYLFFSHLRAPQAQVLITVQIFYNGVRKWSSDFTVLRTAWTDAISIIC